MLYDNPMVQEDSGNRRIDFLIAGRIGNWLIFRSAMRMWRNDGSDQSAACLRFGRGDGVADANEVGQVFDFYRSFWTSIMTGSVVLFAGSGLLVKAVTGVSSLNKVLIALVVAPWAALILAAMVLVGLYFSRRGLSISAYAGKPTREKYGRTASFNSQGTDFWFAVGAGALVYVVMLAALL
jgi:hypothetical protein